MRSCENWLPGLPEVAISGPENRSESCVFFGGPIVIILAVTSDVFAVFSTGERAENRTDLR